MPKKTNAQIVGGRIRVLMEAHGWDTFQLSRKARVREQTISTWLRKKDPKMPGALLLSWTARALGTTADELTKGLKQEGK